MLLRAYSLCFLCGVQKCHLPVRLARYLIGMCRNFTAHLRLEGYKYIFIFLNVGFFCSIYFR